MDLITKKGNVTLKSVQVSRGVYISSMAQNDPNTNLGQKSFFFLLECVEIMVPWYVKVSKLFTSTINHDPYTSMGIVELKWKIQDALTL